MAAGERAPIADRYRKIGWAVGTTDGGEWLTIIGSAYESRLVFPTQAGAESRAAVLRERFVDTQRHRVIVAYVERLGGLYNRILPTP